MLNGARQGVAPRRAPLASFAPDGRRAGFLNARLARELAGSIDRIAEACRGKVAFDPAAVAAARARIMGCRAAGPPVYVAYFDLLDAARRGDGRSLEAHFARLAGMEVVAPPHHMRGWGDVEPALAARYLHYVNVEPGSTVLFEPVSSEVMRRLEAAAVRAFALMDAAVPELSAEIRELVRDLVFVSSPPDQGMRFDGATSFYCWGALFLNAEQHATAMDLVDGLAHESAHAHLFGVSRGRSLVRNPPTERFASPLRADPRPLDGIFHAAFVSARMHYAHDRLLRSGLLAGNQRAEAERGRVAGLRAARDGLATLERHARPTPLGAKVLAGLRAYVAAQG